MFLPQIWIELIASITFMLVRGGCIILKDKLYHRFYVIDPKGRMILLWLSGPTFQNGRKLMGVLEHSTELLQSLV